MPALLWQQPHAQGTAKHLGVLAWPIAKTQGSKFMLTTTSPTANLVAHPTCAHSSAWAPSSDLTSRCGVATSAMGPNLRSVAIVGAGAAGLIAAKELRDEGHAVTVFEASPCVGGVWQYDDSVEDDLRGAKPGRLRVHSSMYRDLRTNLPRELMGLPDFPFDPRVMGGRSCDSRRFCGHAEVLAYLQAYADFFQLSSIIELNTEVVEVQPLIRDSSVHTTPVHHNSSSCNTDFGASSEAVDTTNSSSHGSSSRQSGLPSDQLQWRVVTRARNNGKHSSSTSFEQAEYDAVVVCNGHYSQPNLPELPGMDVYPGLQLHSHNYRKRDEFADKTVLIVGASNSGEDISREICTVAKTVYLSARSWKNEEWALDPAPYGPHKNIYRMPMVSQLNKDGSAYFGSTDMVVHGIDCVLYATGYRYTFPFLPRSLNLVSSGQQHVWPLYKHLFAPSVAPTVAFIGIPWKVVPFPQFQLQAKLVARALSGRVTLPSQEAMLADIQASKQKLEAEGIPERYAHLMNHEQWDYNDWLARMCGPDVSPTASWRPRMYSAVGTNKRKFPETYRDEWCDEEVLELAAHDINRQIQLLLQSRRACDAVAINKDASLVHVNY